MNLSPCPIFSMIFEEKCFLIILYCLNKLQCLVAFTPRDIEQYDVINFETKLIFLIKLLLIQHDQQVKTKIFIIFKRLSMKQIQQIFLEGESPT